MPPLERLTRIAQTTLPVVSRAAKWARSNARRVAEAAVERGREARSSSTSTQAPPPPSAASPSPSPSPAPAPAPAAAPAPAPEHEHVEREAVLVAESADAGAADGAGAEIHVAEPWPGYGEMTAADIIDRLATADAGMLAVVRLYESGQRNRVTVLRESDRRLAATGG